MKKIAVIGSNMTDLITYVDRMPAPGETLEAPQFAIGFGGKGSNQAVAAAKLGAEVMMMTRVGDDLFGRNTLENYRNCGIDSRHAAIAPGMASGVAPIFVDRDGQNSILIIKGANNALLPADVDAAMDDIRQCGLIVLQLEIPLETVYHVIELGAAENIPVLLNPAPAVQGLERAIISRLAMLIPNETELELLTGRPVGSVAQMTAAADELVASGVKTVIVTMGSKGALLVTAEGSRHIFCPQVNAVDTTGAGDAFIGCFASSWVESGDIVASMERAVIYASLSTTRPGTQTALPTRQEFEEFAGRFGV